MNLPNLLGKKCFYVVAMVHLNLTLFHSYNWWALFVMAAMRLDAPVYKDTGPTFCHVTQVIAIAGVVSNYWAGAGIHSRSC